MDYKKIRLEIIKEMTPIRIQLKSEGYIFHEGKVRWLYPGGLIGKSGFVVKAIKKLRAKWTLEAAEDIRAFECIDDSFEAELVAAFTEEVDKAILDTLLTKL